MKQKSFSKLNELNALIEDIFKGVENYSHEQLAAQPSENEWSILQIIEHLRVSEALSINYLNFKKTQSDTYTKTGVKEKFNVFMLKKRMESPKKIKAPEVKGLSPKPDGLVLQEVIESWRTVRSQIKAYFEETDEESFSKNMYKQPVIGRINLFQMLQFFEYHIKRHQRQIQDRISKL